jgi:hypothetical protein
MSFSHKNIEYYNVIAAKCPAIVAKRLGNHLIREACTNDSKVLKTLQLCMHVMECTCYSSTMIDCILDSTEVIKMYTMMQILIKWIQEHASTIMFISSHARCDEFLVFLTHAEDTPNHPASVLSSVFLLQLALHQKLTDSAMNSLSICIQAHPERFLFAETDNVDSLRMIVETAMSLKLPEGIYKKYKDLLRDQKALKVREEKISTLGIDEFAHPSAFICPITMETMKDPVVASDGHTYERNSLERIFNTDDHRSPLTREVLNKNIIVPNINLRKRIRDYADDICDVAEKIQKKNML